MKCKDILLYYVFFIASLRGVSFMSETVFPYNKELNMLKPGQIIISRDKLLQIEKKVVSFLSHTQCKMLLPELRQLRYRSLSEMLLSYSQYASKLASNLDKVLHPLQVEGVDVLIDPEKYGSLLESLEYLFEFIVYHGIEAPALRTTKGKEASARIKCTIKLVTGRIQLTVSDDGSGVDLNHLRDKASLDGIYDPELASGLTKEETLSLIFKNIFPPVESEGRPSLKNAGMAAVKSETERISGTVRIKSRPGMGTDFVFLLPYEGISELPKVSASDILNPLLETTKKFLIDHVGISEDEITNFSISKKENFKLEKLAAFINMKGYLNGKIVISTDERLTRRIVRSFVIQELTPEEESDYVEDVLAEFINIILGGSVKMFAGLEDLIVIEPPIAVYSEGILIKYPGSEIWICDIQTVSGNLCLCFAPEEGRVF